MAPTPALIAACSVFLLLSACTPSAVTPPPTSPATAPTPTPTASQVSPSATPSPTWSADQAAAIAAVDEYRAASDQIAADPASFSEPEMRSLLGKWAGPEVVKANVASYLSLKKRGFRYGGSTIVVSTRATRAADVGYGTEVVITRCIDQRAATVLDKAGVEVAESELGYNIPDFLLRQYTAQKRAADKSFRVYGLAPAKGECGP
ncbi:MAG: hypothetical protein ACK5KO_08990 [Arachnia sp.]